MTRLTNNQDNNNDTLMNGISFIWSYIKKYWISLSFVVIFIIAATWLQIKAPKYMGESIDELAKYISIYMSTGGHADKGDFIVSIFKMVGAFSLSAIAMFFYHILMVGVSSKSTKKIREVLFDKLQRLAIRFFDESNDGDILSRFTNDVDNISTLLNQSFIQIASSIALVVSIAYTMFTENVELATVIVLMAVATFVVVLLITKQAKKYVTQQQAKLGALNGYVDEKITGQKLIITTGTEEETYDGFLPFNEEYRDISKKGQALSNVLFPLVNGVMLTSLGLIIFLGAPLIMDKTLSVGLMVMFIQYTQRFFQPITQIVSQYNVFRLGVTGATRVEEILDQVEDVVNVENAKEFSKIKNSVELKNISFAYNDSGDVLKDVSISLEQGKKIALVGPTGSGKTTIMNLLNRFYDIERGEILFDDVNIKDIELGSLRHNVGIVLQDTVLFSGTIRDNIAYGKPDASNEEVIDAAKAAKIHDYIIALDEGYETYIDDSNAIFSVGQKQLVSIARTILTDPDLLILDEATSNVDTVTEAKIQDAVKNILVNRTSFVIAHRLKTILDADKIVVLKDGEVIEVGSHEELLSEEGFYAQLYHNQFINAT
ncbi:MAG: ABC transporter ATP-binding protein [Erysipelotrichales bacterium]